MLLRRAAPANFAQPARNRIATLRSVVLLAVLFSAHLLDAKPIVPYTASRRRLGLRLLTSLLSDTRDTVSVDIGGTLAKVVLFEPLSAAPATDGRAPELSLHADNNTDAALRQEVAKLHGQYAELSTYLPQLRGTLHFFVFETRHISDIVAFMEQHWAPGAPGAPASPPHIVLRATGGGSYKHAAAFRRVGLVLQQDEEMAAMVMGLNFLLRQVPGEVFELGVTPSSLATPAECAIYAQSYVEVPRPPDEYLYVSIGSGVSILEVRAPPAGDAADAAAAAAQTPTRYRRVGGSSVGGSTFWGLVRLLTSCSTFDEVIRLTERGSNQKVDMLVQDIYGGDCPSIGLDGDVIAASFGKIAMRREQKLKRGPMFFLRYLGALLRHYEEGFWLVILALVAIPGIQYIFHSVPVLKRFRRFAEARAASTAMCGPYHAHDVALSLLRMVSNNIGHIGCLSAQQCGLRHIVFGGSFIRDHPYTLATISSAVHFFSGGQVRALFLKHDGFVGAIGAHIRGVPQVAGAVAQMPARTDPIGRWTPSPPPPPPPPAPPPAPAAAPPAPPPPPPRSPAPPPSKIDASRVAAAGASAAASSDDALET